MQWRGAAVLVTGGLGFIGSNLARRLVGLGARVTLVDAMLPPYGGNLANLEGIEDRVRVNYADLRDAAAMAQVIEGQDLVYHLAGQVSHVDSLRDPFPDLDINVRGTLILLEALRAGNPGARIVYVGTRGQYGPSQALPVDEDAPTHPQGMYEITKLAAENCIDMYDRVHGIRGIRLRLVNTYGPRHQMRHDRYGVLNWFIRKVLDGQPIPVFGDGSILRDFLYVDDAVDALIQVVEGGRGWGRLYNVGSGTGVSFVDLAKAIVSVAGEGTIEFREFTRERLELEPGDYVADIRRIVSETGWMPSTPLEEGLARTIEFYRANRSSYWP